MQFLTKLRHSNICSRAITYKQFENAVNEFVDIKPVTFTAQDRLLVYFDLVYKKEERKKYQALQKAQANELLNCFNRSSDVAKIAADYLGLSSSALETCMPNTRSSSTFPVTKVIYPA